MSVPSTSVSNFHDQHVLTVATCHAGYAHQYQSQKQCTMVGNTECGRIIVTKFGARTSVGAWYHQK